jgi:choline-sulfatase
LAAASATNALWPPQELASFRLAGSRLTSELVAAGPDGALYIADFYRQFVEHPDFVPAKLRGQIPWRIGAEHGRLWRIRDSPRTGQSPKIGLTSAMPSRGRFTALFGAWLALAGAHAARPSRPNILLLLGDDHAAYTLGCYGSRVARTPNLDRLAAQGALFTRAYCNSPVCTPSRQSLLTGRLPHATGVTLLTTPLADKELTLAEVLKAAGYDTAAIGKMHFNSALQHGFDRRLDLPEQRARLRANPPLSLPADVKTTGPWRPFKDPARVWLNSECRPQPAREADMDATFFAEEAVKFLRQPRERPFFLIVSFYQPHSPFQFPVEYAGRFDPKDMITPRPGPEDAAQVPLIFRDLTDAEKRGIAAAYHTAAAFLDANVGRVLAALEASGQATNTLVIYTGDNGYHLGHHGRFEKHCGYEPAVRVPLLARWPGRVKPGTTVEALVELVDLFPTITAACGVGDPPDRHGRSLLPLLLGRTKRHRDHVVSQYHENEEAMVRTDRWKLIYCTGRRARQDGYLTDNPTPGRYVKLFDEVNDPDEWVNLAADPRHARQVAQLKRLLLDRLEATANANARAPRGLSLEEKLDWYLVPSEVRRGAAASSTGGR